MKVITVNPYKSEILQDLENNPTTEDLHDIFNVVEYLEENEDELILEALRPEDQLDLEEEDKPATTKAKDIKSKIPKDLLKYLEGLDDGDS